MERVTIYYILCTIRARVLGSMTKTKTTNKTYQKLSPSTMKQKKEQKKQYK